MKQIFLAIITCLLLLSCTTGSHKPTKQLEELTIEIRDHHLNYSLADWENVYTRYEQIAKDMESYTYSAKEMERIGELEGECVGYFLNSAKNSMGGIRSEIDGFLEGLNKSME